MLFLGLKKTISNLLVLHIPIFRLLKMRHRILIDSYGKVFNEFFIPLV